MQSLWMLVAGLCYAVTGLLFKSASRELSAAELTLWRAVLPTLAIGCWALYRGQSFRTPHWQAHLARGLAGCLSMGGYIYAITQLPLATAVTLNYTSPLFLAILTTLALRERFSGLLLTAVAIGFAGVLVLLQPTLRDGDLIPGLIGLGSGFVAATAYLNVRTLGRAGEPEWRVVFYFSLIASVLAVPWQLSGAPLRWPPASVVAEVLGIGAVALAGQLAMTRAYQHGNTLTASALSFLTIVWSAVVYQWLPLETLALAVFDQQAMALGRLFTIAANFTDPDAFFVGGGVVEAAPEFRDWFLGRVRSHTDLRDEQRDATTIDLVPDRDMAGARGAAGDASPGASIRSMT